MFEGAPAISRRPFRNYGGTMDDPEPIGWKIIVIMPNTELAAALAVAHWMKLHGIDSSVVPMYGDMTGPIRLPILRHDRD